MICLKYDMSENSSLRITEFQLQNIFAISVLLKIETFNGRNIILVIIGEVVGSICNFIKYSGQRRWEESSE